MTNADGSKQFNMDCFQPGEDVDPCDNGVCMSDISSITNPEAEEDETILIHLCADAASENTGDIWEINFSALNESGKIEGFLAEASRERLRTLEDIPDFNTQLTFVSIVGGRGVGKSTVASLLSGNSSMFEVIWFNLSRPDIILVPCFRLVMHQLEQQPLELTSHLLFHPRNGQACLLKT